MEVWEKSETVDPEVRAYVHSLVNAVGGQSTLDDRYAVGDDALAVLHDLLRWLRLYDDKLDRLDVKRCLAEANLVKGDLLEILALWPAEAQENKVKAKLALACLQLLVPLTWPIELDEDKTTVNHHRHTPYLLLAQAGYKRSILHFEDAPILRTAIRAGLPSMAESRRERSRRDEGIIKMTLYLFRNLAMITQPQHLPSLGDENEISRSSTIDVFHAQDVFSFLLTIASGANDEFQEQDVIILEILFHLLKGVDARKLFMENEQMANEETNELEMLMRKEKAMHKGYNKHAPTRHNRFGTVIWVKRDEDKVSTVSGQNSITNEETTLHQMDSTKRYNKPQYRGKSSESDNENSDFRMRTEITDSAKEQLRGFVEDFLDSSFNPVFASLRKAIEREADKVLPVHHKQYFYLVSWFLVAEGARRERCRKNQASLAAGSAETNTIENTYAYIAAVLDQETFVLLNRHMQRALDEKHWQELSATLLCFTQILLTVQSMAESEDDEDQEIAENIQNRIFYEEATHDRMVQILRGCTNQGFTYLDNVTECIHVFVRMLERYSKQNVDLQIRSKRRARNRKRQASGKDESHNNGEPQEEDGDGEDAAEDEREAELTVRERKFDFSRFSAKFLSQPCVDTFVSLLHFYADLTPAQLKRCHRYFYRLAFKHELTVLLFRIDILQLLHRMIKGPGGLSPGIEGYQEWEQLVQQVFRRCIKWLERPSEGEGWREAAVVEMLFSKIPNTLYYLQNGYDRVVERRAPRPPAELEIKSSVIEEQRLPVAVTMMIEQGKQGEIEWLKREMKKAIEERQAWEEQQIALRTSGPEGSQAEVREVDGAPTAPAVFLIPDTDERKLALFKDKFLRLLLATLGIERVGGLEDLDASWIVPAEISSTELSQHLASIQKTEFDAPTFDGGKTAADLIRNKSTTRRGATFSDTDSGGDGEADGDVDESLFPPNLREKRKHGDVDEQPKKKRRLTQRKQSELTEEQIQARAEERRQRAKDRNAKIKSQLFITASDDESDEEADVAFFRREEEQRKRTVLSIKRQLLEEGARRQKGEKESKKKKAKGGKDPDHQARVQGEDGDEDMRLYTGDLDASSEESDANDVQTLRFGPKGRSDRVAPTHEEDGNGTEESDARSSSDDDEDTPSTSPLAPDEKVLAEVSGNAASRRSQAVNQRGSGDEDEDEDEEMPLAKRPAARRNVRAGFIIDDSDEE